MREIEKERSHPYRRNPSHSLLAERIEIGMFTTGQTKSLVHNVERETAWFRELIGMFVKCVRSMRASSIFPGRNQTFLGAIALPKISLAEVILKTAT